MSVRLIRSKVQRFYQLALTAREPTVIPEAAYMRGSHGIAQDGEANVLGHLVIPGTKGIDGRGIRRSVQGLTAERLVLEHISNDALAARDILPKVGGEGHDCVLWAERLSVNYGWRLEVKAGWYGG